MTFFTAGFPAQKMIFLPGNAPQEVVDTYTNALNEIIARDDFMELAAAELGVYPQMTGAAAQAALPSGHTCRCRGPRVHHQLAGRKLRRFAELIPGAHAPARSDADRGMSLPAPGGPVGFPGRRCHGRLRRTHGPVTKEHRDGDARHGGSPALIEALALISQPQQMAFLVIGVLLGLSVGIFPGLGGIAGLSLVLPFIFGMDPVSGLALMVGLIAVVPTSDTFSSVLMGIPGSTASQATVLDGFPLAKKGQAARALSAAFISSLFGGLLGATVLTAFILVARPLILALNIPAMLAITLLGLSDGGDPRRTHPAQGCCRQPEWA